MTDHHTPIRRVRSLSPQQQPELPAQLAKATRASTVLADRLGVTR
jgi:hypothetical protein